MRNELDEQTKPTPEKLPKGTHAHFLDALVGVLSTQSEPMRRGDIFRALRESGYPIPTSGQLTNLLNAQLGNERFYKLIEIDSTKKRYEYSLKNGSNHNDSGESHGISEPIPPIKKFDRESPPLVTYWPLSPIGNRIINVGDDFRGISKNSLETVQQRYGVFLHKKDL